MLVLVSRQAGRKATYRCECGEQIVAFVTNVNRGHTSSCGCLRIRATRDRSRTHGHRTNRKKTRAYAVWVNMKARCSDPSRPDYANYGARGIAVCERWRDSFAAFIADMGPPPPGLTLDRRDNERGYSKDNCQWATRADQGLNKRNCVRYSLNGESKTLAEWSRGNGIGRATMLKRLQRGVPVGIALTHKGFLKMPTNDATNALIRIA